MQQVFKGGPHGDVIRRPAKDANVVDDVRSIPDDRVLEDVARVLQGPDNGEMQRDPPPFPPHICNVYYYVSLGLHDREHAVVDLGHRGLVLVDRQRTQVVFALAILLHLQVLAVLALIAAAAFVKTLSVKKVGIGRTGDGQGDEMFGKVQRYVPRVIADRELLGIPGLAAFGQTRVAQTAVGFTDVKPHGIAVEVRGGQERGAASIKGVNNKLTLMCEEFDRLFYEGDGEGRGMDRFISDIALLIAEAPYAKLTFDPFFCGETIEMFIIAIACSFIPHIQFFGAALHESLHIAHLLLL